MTDNPSMKTPNLPLQLDAIEDDLRRCMAGVAAVAVSFDNHNHEATLTGQQVLRALEAAEHFGQEAKSAISDLRDELGKVLEV